MIIKKENACNNCVTHKIATCILIIIREKKSAPKNAIFTREKKKIDAKGKSLYYYYSVVFIVFCAAIFKFFQNHFQTQKETFDTGKH